MKIVRTIKITEPDFKLSLEPAAEVLGVTPGDGVDATAYLSVLMDEDEPTTEKHRFISLVPAQDVIEKVKPEEAMDFIGTYTVKGVLHHLFEVGE